MLVKKHKLIESLVKIKLRMNWGQEISSMITTPLKDAFMLSGAGGILIMVLDKYAGVKLPFLTMYIVVFSAIILNKGLDYWFGRKMEKVGFKQREQTYITKDINPHLRELAEDVQEIKKLCRTYYKKEKRNW